MLALGTAEKSLLKMPKCSATAVLTGICFGEKARTAVVINATGLDPAGSGTAGVSVTISGIELEVQLPSGADGASDAAGAAPPSPPPIAKLTRRFSSGDYQVTSTFAPGTAPPTPPAGGGGGGGSPPPPPAEPAE